MLAQPASVRSGVPAQAADVYNRQRLSAASAYPSREAQMQAFTQFNPQPCLRQDDIEGLAVLYPDCSEVAMYGNVCHIVDLNIGWVRDATWASHTVPACRPQQASSAPPSPN